MREVSLSATNATPLSHTSVVLLCAELGKNTKENTGKFIGSVNWTLSPLTKTPPC